MKQQVEENVSVDSTLQNHGFNEFTPDIGVLVPVYDVDGDLLRCDILDSGYHAFCSCCDYCYFYDCDYGVCSLSECTYRPYRKEADDE